MMMDLFTSKEFELELELDCELDELELLDSELLLLESELLDSEDPSDSIPTPAGCCTGSLRPLESIPTKTFNFLKCLNGLKIGFWVVIGCLKVN